MPNSNHPLTISGKKAKKKSFQQKTFNTLARKIPKLRKELVLVESVAKTLNPWYDAKIAPIAQELEKQRVEWIRMLDAAYDQKYFRKNEKEKISYLIAENLYPILDSDPHKELKKYTKNMRARPTNTPKKQKTI